MAAFKLFGLLAIVAFSLQSCLGIVQTTIYAGTKNGLAISHDEGISWPKIEFRNGPVGAVTSDGNGSVYIGASNGVFKTSDDEHFENLTNTVPTKNIRSLIAIEHGKEIYAGSEYYQGNIRYTHDAGKVWGEKAIGQKTSMVSGLAESNGTIYALANNSGLYFSQDKGDSWKLLKTNFSLTNANALFVSSGIIYVGTDSGLFKSEDAGKTWAKVRTGLDDYTTAVFVRRVEGTTKDTIVAASYSGVAISRDNGVSWKLSNDNIYSVISLYVTEDGTIYAGSLGNGLYVSGDGIVWFQTTTTDGLPDNNVIAVYAEARKITDD